MARERLIGKDATTGLATEHYGVLDGFTNQVSGVETSGFSRISAIVVPIHAGAGDPTATVEVWYDVRGTWRKRNPGGSGNLNKNEANVVTTEDVVEGVRVVCAKSGANPQPDGGWDVVWWGWRD